MKEIRHPGPDAEIIGDGKIFVDIQPDDDTKDGLDYANTDPCIAVVVDGVRVIHVPWNTAYELAAAIKYAAEVADRG